MLSVRSQMGSVNLLLWKDLKIRDLIHHFIDGVLSLSPELPSERLG